MFSGLKEKVLYLAKIVGFKEVRFDVILEKESPAPVTYLESTYASILIWPVDNLSPNKLTKEAISAERLLDERLTERESSGVVIDGYVIIALDRFYDELKSEVLEVEQNTRLCRKHIVWEDSENWVRLERVTTLGFSLPSEISDFADVPSLDFNAQKLIDELNSTQPRALARKHDTWSAQ